MAAITTTMPQGRSGGGGGGDALAALLVQTAVSRAAVKLEPQVIRDLIRPLVDTPSHESRNEQWGAHVAESILVPFVVQFCHPEELVKCVSCCRKLSGCNLGSHDFVVHWLSGFCAAAKAEVLHLAVQLNLPSLARSAVGAKADVNFGFEPLWRRTPLHRAATRGNAEMCQLLLELRATAAARDSLGAAPLHLVASRGRLPIVELLLRSDEGGASAVDSYGRTPFHMAALKGHVSIVLQLLQRRASINAEADDGCTPVDMARRNQHHGLVALLEHMQQDAERRDEFPAAT